MFKIGLPKLKEGGNSNDNQKGDRNKEMMGYIDSICAK
jgi:hypothetical protein